MFQSHIWGGCFHPVGCSATLDAVDPSREQRRVPSLTTPGNESLQTLFRVTSANHNDSFHSPTTMKNNDTKTRTALLHFFFLQTLRPQIRLFYREVEGPGVQLCFHRLITQMSLFAITFKFQIQHMQPQGLIKQHKKVCV